MRAIQKAKELDYFALLFDAGTGKSRTLIEILRDKFAAHGTILPTIIICPPIVIKNWENEWARYSKVKPEYVIPVVGSGKERANIIKSSTNPAILIMNYESLLMDDVRYAIAMWVGITKLPAVLVLDEAHKIKDVSSKRAKFVHTLSRLFKYRYILTGTPILNSLMDIFSQFKALDNGVRFGSSFFVFRNTYFHDKNKGMPAGRHFPEWRANPDAEKIIKQKISDCSMVAHKKDCLDLPPLVKKVLEVEMGPEQARLYKSMRTDLIAVVETEGFGDRSSIAELAITKALRLQQIVSGHIKVEGLNGEEGINLKIKDNPRKKALTELLENLTPQAKVIVWAVFKDNYADIRTVCEELEVKCAELHGEIKDKDSEINKFRNDEDVRVLIGHPGSGGIGVNLIEASYMIYYSRSFSLEFDIQSEARNYRGGSEIHDSVTRIDLVTPGTIDELVMKSLANKQKLSDKILKAHIGEI